MDPENKKLYESIKERALQIIESKDLKKINERIAELEQNSVDPTFWNDNEKAQKKMQELGDLKQEIDSIKNLERRITDIEIFLELSDEGENASDDINNALEETENFLKKLETQTFLSGKFDAENAIFSIHAGQGGTEACDWADMLLRMYIRFFETRGWKTEIINEVMGDEAGIKSVSLQIYGRYAYGYLKKEHGTHRLVRISPFNSQGLRQTSFAGVEVTPLIEDDIELDIKDDDLEFTAVRSGGPGGQSVNKTSSSVRIVHKPTGIVVTCSSERSQLQNRKFAMNLLKGKLIKIEEETQEKALAKEKGDHKIASWGNQIRNYILHPYKLVKDLRTGIETDQVENVLDGKLDEFIEAEVRL